jgi:hypothetical protein
VIFNNRVMKCDAKNTEKEQSKNIIQYIRYVRKRVRNESKRVQMRKRKIVELNRLKQINNSNK